MSYRSTDIYCPYCGKGQEINHDDGYGYDEDRTHQQECSDCGKTYTYTTSILYVYSADKADCLNDEEHDFELTTTYPKEYSMMRCKMCDEERQPTQEEREKYNLDVKR